MLTANSIQAEFEDFDPMGRFKCVIYGEAQSSVKCSNREDCSEVILQWSYNLPPICNTMRYL